MSKKFKVICTIGPASNNAEILQKLADRGADFFRINLSHTNEEDIENRIKDLMGYGVPIILDTEGSQIRSGNTHGVEFEEGGTINIHNKRISCDNENLFLTPLGTFSNLHDGDLISLDFNSALLRVFNTKRKDNGIIECKIVIAGLVGGKKAVQVDSPSFSLPPFSKKDHTAIELAKKYGIKHFTLSFMESPESVLKFKEKYPDSTIYSKIESKKGLENFMEIAKVSNGVLIDRGDLSSQIPLEKIPLIQKFVINKVRSLGKEVFVATNTLEQMALALKPNKAEINDITNTLLDGASGIALTKETAVGKYPVETLNTLMTIMKQLEFIDKSDKANLIDKLEDLNYLTSNNFPEMLPKPHGEVLVNRFVPNYQKPLPEKRIETNEETLMDAEQIALGAFSPLEGFMGKDDLNSVAEEMRLQNGLVWPLLITLSVPEAIKDTLAEGEDILLTYKGQNHAILHLEEIFSLNKEEIAKKIFKTSDKAHPGAKKFIESGDFFLGGKITLLKRKDSNNKVHELTPRQTRRIFSERGWSKVVGFHTRNVIHRSHEFIQLGGLKRGLCDGLFVHPVIGKKKPGDFESDVIIKTYEKMIEKFYPSAKAVLGTFATYSRYAGPREALFTALVRKNFGCSHFIVGRDHTGVGDFYKPHDSHEIFNRFTKEELGITSIKFDKVFYSDIEEKYIHEPDFIDHPEKHKLHISGTQARKMLSEGKNPPEWFMRPEISKIIVDKIKNGEKVFVE